MYRNSEVSSKLAVLALSALPAVLAPQAMAGTIALPVTTDVTVTNSSLPVTGSVSVSNTAANPVPVSITAASPVPVTITGNVSVGGTSSVSVTNTPSVVVSNSSLMVQAADNPAFQPYSYSLSSACTSGSPGVLYLYSPAVPSGKTLVIETIDASVQAPTGIIPFLTVTTSLPGSNAAYHAIPLTSEGTDPRYTFFAGNSAVRYYTGGILNITLAPADGTTSALSTCLNTFTVSGYLVNNP